MIFLGKPIFLYQKDYCQYIHERNFYVPIEQLPYISARINEELPEKILGFDEDNYRAKLLEFMGKMKNYDNGHAAEKIATHIMKICF